MRVWACHWDVSGNKVGMGIGMGTEEAVPTVGMGMREAVPTTGMRSAGMGGC